MPLTCSRNRVHAQQHGAAATDAGVIRSAGDALRLADAIFAAENDVVGRAIAALTNTDLDPV